METVDNEENNLIHSASIWGNLAIIEKCFKIGVPGEILNKYGFTAFDHAVNNSRTNVIGPLVRQGGAKLDREMIDIGTGVAFTGDIKLSTFS